MNAPAKTVIAAIARGDIDTAQRAFKVAADKTSIGNVARAVCQATPPPAGTIVVGPALLVWANPYRTDYGWRCGSCRWTASTYKTRRNAEKVRGPACGGASRRQGSLDHKTDRSLTVAQLKFRLTCITLDTEEDPKDVAAVVDSDAYEVIIGYLGTVTTTDTRRGGTEMTVVLPINDASKLFHECGKLNSLDPRYDKGGSEIYNSLTMVFYGIMGE